jgi:tetratricopeptide (TPR) repeat protein
VLLCLDANSGEQYDFGREIGHVNNPGTLIFTPEGGLISQTERVITTEALMKVLRDTVLAYTKLSDAKKAQKEKPEDSRANFSLGCAYYNGGKDKEAREYFQKYLELIEKAPEEGQGEPSEKEGREGEEKEKSEVDKSFEADAHFRLGVIDLREGDEKKAQEHFTKAIDLDTGGRKKLKAHIAWEKLKLLLKDGKKQAEAKDAARKLVDEHPKSAYVAKCLMIIGDICIAQRNIEGAVDAWLELQDKRFGSIEYPEMRKLLTKYWNQSPQSKKGK